jgi:acetyl-CoA acetyltransferase
MPDAVIVNAVRSPIGAAFRGSLTETPPEELARIVLAEAGARSSILRPSTTSSWRSPTTAAAISRDTRRSRRV